MCEHPCECAVEHMQKVDNIATCGMNVANRCPYPPFPFSITPDTGIGSDYLNRTFVGALAQPSVKQSLQCLTPFHIGKPAAPVAAIAHDTMDSASCNNPTGC